MLTKNEPGGELSEAEFGSLVDFGSFTRVDFMNWFIPKKLSRTGVDRFALFGYETEESLYWQGAIGPLNVLIFFVILLPIAALLTIAGCKWMKVVHSRRINFAAFSYLFGYIDRLFTFAQMHFLILTMLSFRESRYLACFLLILFVFWPIFVRHYVLLKV